MRAHADRPPRRRLARCARLTGSAPARAGMLPLRARPLLRPRPRPRLQRPRDRRPRARHPRGQHARLRVRGHPAPDRLPARQAGDVPGLGPARAAAALRRRPREAVPLPGPEGGVLPLRLRARSRGARAALGLDTERVVVDRPPAARRLALPPQVEPALPQGPRTASASDERRPRGGPAAHPGAARVTSSSLRAALADRPRPARSRRRAWSPSPTSSSPPAAR